MPTVSDALTVNDAVLAPIAGLADASQRFNGISPIKVRVKALNSRVKFSIDPSHSGVMR